MKRYFSIILLIILTLFFISATNLEYGYPKNQEYANYYLEKGLEDTGAMNLVAAVYLDYRAYDTLIETIILFMAVAGVTFFLRREK